MTGIAPLFLAILGCFSLYALGSSRANLLMILGIGFSQDMVRKLTPGEPIFYIITVGILFGAVLLGLWARQGFGRSLAPFTSWTQTIVNPLIAFVLLLAVQLLYSLVAYGNIFVGLIGLTTYLAPFIAVIVGYALVDSIDAIRRFMWIYVFIGCSVALSVGFSFMGYELSILKEVGLGVKIYDQGTVLKSHAGIMRTGEIAAWHISTTACLFVALAMSAKRSGNFYWVATVVVLLMVAVALTGRRKMLMLASLFVLLYFLALPYYRQRLSAVYFFNVLAIVVAVWLGYEFLNLDGYNSSLRDYIARSSTVFADASSRFVGLGIVPIQWAYSRVGLLGGGLGIASQGSYLFSASNVAGGSGEGGLGKIMVELGLPGIVIIAWLIFVSAKHVDKCLRLAGQSFVDQRILPVMVGLAVLLGVNAVTFSVATQVYGDVFILIMMGLFGGFIFALPKIVINSMQQPPAPIEVPQATNPRFRQASQLQRSQSFPRSLG